MRPLFIPDNPINYNEKVQLETLVYQGYDLDKLKRWKSVDKKKMLDTLNNLINQWIEEGGKVSKQGTVLFKNKSDQANYEQIFGMLENGNHTWGEARKDLINTIGQYCSYCDSPIYSNLHIEHQLPKSFFANKVFSWGNFLLSCPTCNSAKGNNPNQATVDKPKILRTEEAIKHIMNEEDLHFYWPKISNNSDRTGSIYPFVYALKKIGTYRKKPRFEEQLTEQEINELFSKFKSGELYIDNGRYYYLKPDDRTKYFFGIETIPNPACSESIRQAAAKTIEMASLNKFVKVKDSSKSVDRRMEMRTRAFFVARWIREQLIDAMLHDDSDILYPKIMKFSKRTIAATGFWGIWFQELGGWTGEEKQQLLQSCLPGTNPKYWLDN
ncbi:HNH endonuclease [Aneurinibacillus sp. REN35]|uniref:HNH endonuclease n=1 Tax=Aneurinibacillus sp. REN35 TaxID=3237286 RepID=UPI003527ADA3